MDDEEVLHDVPKLATIDHGGRQPPITTRHLDDIPKRKHQSFDLTTSLLKNSLSGTLQSIFSGNHHALTNDIARYKPDEVPSMVGRKLPLSNLKNIPMFTLSPRTDLNRKQVISSKHLVDVLGRDSPGVGAYQYDFDKLSRSVLNANMSP